MPNTDLPAPVPQLDFPVTEGLRQHLVAEYRAMLTQMQAALAQAIDAAPLGKSYAAATDDAQMARRGRLVRYLMRMGVAKAAFDDGGELANSSDGALRDMAIKMRDQKRKGQQRPKALR